jgi:hypothetical protein
MFVAMLVGLTVLCAPLELLTTTHSTMSEPVHVVGNQRRSWPTPLSGYEYNVSQSLVSNMSLETLYMIPAARPTNHTSREIAFNQSGI